jgi:hypothetical protein
MLNLFCLLELKKYGIKKIVGGIEWAGLQFAVDALF